jgi:ABC-type antimicrobial peptide transport system permease subunit
LLGRMRQVALSLDPEMPLYRAETLEEHLDLPLLPSRLAATAFASFGAVTMLLAAIGLYGVMAFAVTRRTREIGIRMAVGATPGQVAGLVLRRTMVLVGSGAAVGLALAFFAGGLLEPLLVGVRGRDPWSLLAGVLVMAAVALVASWMPARRAMGMDPARALRVE